jgi:hypothetical protein
MQNRFFYCGGSWTYGAVWFRLWNEWGIAFYHRSIPPLFSERYGYRKVWPKWPARWRFTVLPPNRIEGAAMARAYSESDGDTV